MIAFAILSIIIQAYACVKLLKTRAFHGILAFSLIFYSVLWIMIPGAISVSIYFGLLGDRFSPYLISDDYVDLYLLESLIFLCVIAGSAYLGRMAFGAQLPRGEKQPSRNFLIFVFLGFSLSVATLFLLGDGLTYLERNDASAYDNNREMVLLKIIYAFLGAAVSYSAIILEGRKIITMLLFMSILVAAGIETLNGSRIAMLFPVFVYFCRMHVQSKSLSAKTIKIAALSLLIASFFMPVAMTIGEIRGGGEMNINALAESDPTSTPVADVAATLFVKFNSFTPGLDLIEGYGAGSAGINPYVGSALVFLPRFIFPDRPVAGSVDGTIYGTPPRLVPKLHMASEYMNVGVSPYAISVWHFGWVLGAGLLIIVGVFYLLLLQNLLIKRGIMYKVIAIYAINIPTFLGVFNSPDALIKNTVEIGIVSICLGIFFTILRPHAAQHKIPRT